MASAAAQTGDSPISPIAAVIFDADGMLINGERFSAVLARDFDVDEAKEKEFFTTTFQDCLIGAADLKASIAPYLRSFGWPGTPDEFLEYWFKSEHSIDEQLIADVQTLRAAGIVAVLATNQEKYRTDYMLEHMGFGDVFDVIFASAHLGLKKPESVFFAKVLEQLKLPKNAALFWDDDERNVAGARAFGIAAERYTDRETFLATMQQRYGLLK